VEFAHHSRADRVPLTLVAQHDPSDPAPWPVFQLDGHVPVIFHSTLLVPLSIATAAINWLIF
jgi:hypothetical protein